MPKVILKGLKAKHAVISDSCVKLRGELGASEFANDLLTEEFLRLRKMNCNKRAKFHFVLILERP